MELEPVPCQVEGRLDKLLPLQDSVPLVKSLQALDLAGYSDRTPTHLRRRPILVELACRRVLQLVSVEFRLQGQVSLQEHNL